MGGTPTSDISVAVIIVIGLIIGYPTVRWGGGGQDTEVSAVIHTWNNDDDHDRLCGIYNTNLDHIVCSRGGGVGALGSSSLPSHYFWIVSQFSV